MKRTSPDCFQNTRENSSKHDYHNNGMGLSDTGFTSTVFSVSIIHFINRAGCQSCLSRLFPTNCKMPQTRRLSLNFIIACLISVLIKKDVRCKFFPALWFHANKGITFSTCIFHFYDYFANRSIEGGLRGSISQFSLTLGFFSFHCGYLANIK